MKNKKKEDLIEIKIPKDKTKELRKRMIKEETPLIDLIRFYDYPELEDISLDRIKEISFTKSNILTILISK